jgi:hypothetical protein
MRKVYRVTTYQDKETFTVTVNEGGVVAVDGLSPALAASLVASVKRFIDRYGLAPVTALGKAVGPYSFVTDVDEDPVPDKTPRVAIS